MSKYLIIAEKPSVANDIAKALTGFTKKTDYFESDEYVVASAVGHLLEIAAPEEYEVKRGKWTFNHLPVIPPYFDLRVIERSKSRLNLLVKLIKRKDIIGIINACDAGREGELIFRYIYQYSKTDKPIYRLWLQSMTAQSIRDGFEHLRTDQDVFQLAEAARCRSEADWLVGINGTRAMTAFNSKSGGFQLTTVGRVQTPTLTILVDREEKIRKFKAKPYWILDAEFEYQGERYLGHWFDEHFQKSDNPDARADRLWSEKQAIDILQKTLGKIGQVSEESKPVTQSPPLLYDLTSLQREANTRFGFSAKTTLSAAQALYERHKVLTYPRTDARALPEDYIATTKSILRQFVEKAPSGFAYTEFASTILDKSWVKPSPRIFNNKKISDHFAIIPTHTLPKSLSEVESKIYDMVVRRFLSVFYPVAEYKVTTRITRVEDETFKTEGKVLVVPGWLSVYGKDSMEDDQIIPVESGAIVNTPTVNLLAKETRAPARYSEATLLSAMEGAGKLVEDEELRAAMSAKGLGTPATRAAIIEGLIDEKYVIRQQKELIPTAKAFSLLVLLRGLSISELCSPELTGHWEHELSLIEKGEKSRPEFMDEIREVTKKIVEQAKNYDSDTVPGEFATLSVPCPQCGGVLKETYKKFMCMQCSYGFWKIMAGRQLEPAEVEELLTKREVGPLEGFRSKMGRPFNAKIKLNDDNMPEFDFGTPAPDENTETIDFSDKPHIGKCPACEKGQVYEYGNAYICDQIQADPACKFRLSKMILQRAIETDQAEKLLNQRKTDLIKGFISKKGRPFSAFLVLDKDGKIGFEFEKKTPKTTAAKKTSTAKKAEDKEATAAPESPVATKTVRKKTNTTKTKK